LASVVLLRYVLARLAWAVVLFWAITVFTFVLFFVLPQPQNRAPGRAGQDDVNTRDALELSGPVYQQYGQFVTRFVRDGSLGRSYRNRREVNEIVRAAAPVTLSLVLGGAVIWLLIAFPVGVLSALRPRSLLDRAGMVFVLIGISAHPAWVSIMLEYAFSFRLGFFPVGGYCDLFSPAPSAECGGPTQWAYHLVLPWFALALLFAALYARMIRAAVLETIDEDYVRTARAKGAGPFSVLRRHVLRNALLPVVTMLGMDIGMFLTGTIFIESVFSLPGLGGLLRTSIQTRDLPVILGVVMFTTTAILLLNLVVDLLYAAIDPRVRTVEPRSSSADRAQRRTAATMTARATAPTA
jgi:peptide/nickel transport system permease protein